MISELHIENIAVIKKLTVNFSDGFSVLTGETGAGKSIIIDSVNLLLGARSARELIRNGESQALVSACFTELSERTLSGLAELDIRPEEDGALYIQRTLSADGRAQSKVNGRSVPAATLKEIGKLLITIHGQHDSQDLLAPEKHIDYLDASAHTEELLSDYQSCYQELLRIRKELRNTAKSEQEIADRTDTLTFQIGEIDSAKLKAGEEEALLTKREKIKNIEKISRYSTEIFASLKGGEGGALSASDQIARALQAAEKLEDVLPDQQKIMERLEFCRYELQDIAEAAEALTDGETGDPEAELDRIETRLDLIARLEKRYGESIPKVLEYREKAAKELSELKNNDKAVRKLKQELASKIKEAQEKAEKLTERRTEYAEKLSQEITDQLHYLDLEKASFCVSVTPMTSENGTKRFSANGCDTVEFLITANPGEPLKPLSKVASGGELSRVMLALKSVLADGDGVQTVIFDEIDTGVSGKTSQKIGIKLRALGKGCQVFSITHSAQVAAAGDSHFKIAKTEVDGRAETSVKELSKAERVDELSRIMGGIEITETLRKTAEEMLENAGNYEY
ncbi:MAG: DNA repair protein RecN [Ruminococcaceae bacterium]|nr:DNA repair protein RecN [Oscillospiraceae bacterium]